MWIYNSQPILTIPDEAVAFVYIITNITNNKKYIGKKSFYSTKYKTINKKKKRIKIESDWISYQGSNQITATLDPSILVKEIIHICYSKSEASYLEAKLQFQYDAIISDQFYNDWISVKVTRKHLQKYKSRISIDTP